MDVSSWQRRALEALAVLAEVGLCVLASFAAIAFLGGRGTASVVAGVLVGLVLAAIFAFVIAPGARWRLVVWERAVLVMGLGVLVALVLITHDRPALGAATAFGALVLGLVELLRA